MKLYEVVFSPTGGTQKVSGFLSKELGGKTVKIDLSDYKTDFSKFGLTGEDIAIIAIPSYSGRVPVPAAERLSRIQANGAKAIVGCVYGNRAYEDTLAELQDIVERAGFTVIAAVAAVAEHSIARRYATNRPDQRIITDSGRSPV